MLIVKVNKEIVKEWDIPSSISIIINENGFVLAANPLPKESSFIKQSYEGIFGLENYACELNGINYSIVKSRYRIYTQDLETQEEIIFYGSVS